MVISYMKNLDEAVILKACQAMKSLIYEESGA